MPGAAMSIADAHAMLGAGHQVRVAGRAVVGSHVMHERSLDVAIDDGTAAIRVFRRQLGDVVVHNERLDNDNVFEIPMGAGIGWKTSGFLVDVRGEYRYSFDDNLAPSTSRDADPGDSAHMHRWGVNANLGVEF